MPSFEKEEFLQRLNRLERENTVMKYTAGLLLLLIVAIACSESRTGASTQNAATAPTSASFDIVTARQVHLEDAQGIVRARLSVRADVDGPMLQFLDKAGRVRASFGLGGEQAGLVFFDDNNTPIIGLADSGNGPAITFFNEKKIGRAQLGLTKEGQPNLILANEKGDLAAVVNFLPETGPKIYLLGIRGGGVWSAP
ncbi:MAG: hypothetical protein L0312_17055 [Acidobacteria bacterium]|nr:hypothetical protein [Acidobacteriota bacterium]